MPESTRKHHKCAADNESLAEYTLLNESDTPNRMEIALETISPLALRLMLLLWYGVLLFGLMMIRLDLHMQWEVSSSEDALTVESSNTMSIKEWPEYNENAITWHARSLSLTGSRYARFPHVLIAIKETESKDQPVPAKQLTLSEGAEYASNVPHFRSILPNHEKYAKIIDETLLNSKCVKNEARNIPSTFNVRIRGTSKGKLIDYSKNATRTLRCSANGLSCETVLLPLDVPPSMEMEDFSLTMHTDYFGVPSTALKPSIHFLNQKSSYTIFGTVLRYFLFFVSLTNLILFLSKLGVQYLLPHRSKHILIEQIWVLILQGFFLLYANPFHLSCVFRTAEESFKNKVLLFMEFHIADYFTYVVLTWNLVLVNCARFIPKRLPTTTHLLCVSGLIAMMGLDCLLVVLSCAGWSQTAQDFELTLSESSPAIRVVLFILLTLQYSYFISGFLLAVKLYFKLSKAPYFETRTQQLSFRLFVFVMWLYYVYRIIQSVALHHGTQLASLLSYHQSHQLSELLIAFVYTQIVTYSYSPTRHNENTPPPPTSSLWKRIVWSDAWHQWLRHHGGSLYFFNTCAEEDKFNRIQAIANANRPREHGDNIRPVQFLERLLRKIARRFTNILTLRTLTRMQNRGFFCLEKAVDCFNLSWEVYFRIPKEKASVDLTSECDVPIEETTEKKRTAFLPPEIFKEGVQDTPRSVERSPGNAVLEGPLAQRGLNTAQEVREMDIDRFGFEVIKTFLIEDVQALICSNERSIVIAFRGTTTRKNVKYDIKFSRSNIEVGTKNFLLDLLFVPCVHSGFNILWKKIESELLKELYRLLSPRNRQSTGSTNDSGNQSKPTSPRRFGFRRKQHQPPVRAEGKEVIVTGHSLGGAIANLCAYSIANRFDISPTVYTFGSPRIGNTRFRHLYDEKVPNTFRIVNQSDIVSRFNLMMDNPHVGCEIAIDRHGNIICHPTFIERILRPWSRGLGLHHHLLASYGQSLNAVAKRHGVERLFTDDEKV